MSYSFRVVVKNGRPHVDHKSPATTTVPDGEFIISGHEDDSIGGRRIGVTRFVSGETESGQRYTQIAAEASGYASGV